MRQSHIDAIYKKIVGDDELTYNDRIIKHFYEQITEHDPDVTIKNGNHIYPNLLLRIMTTTMTRPKDGMLSKCEKLTKRVIEFQLKSQENSVGNSMKILYDDYLESVSSRITQNHIIHNLVDAHTVLNELVSKLPKIDSINLKETPLEDVYGKCKYVWSDMKTKLYWNRNTAIIEHNGIYTLVPKTYILMIHNKISDLLSVLLLSASYHESLYEEDMVAATLEFTKLMAKLASKLQKKFFQIAKVLEGLVIGEILCRVEGRSNRKFLKSIVDGLEEEIDWYYDNSDLSVLLQTKSLPCIIYELLGCLSKLFGHPFVWNLVQNNYMIGVLNLGILV